MEEIRAERKADIKAELEEFEERFRKSLMLEVRTLLSEFGASIRASLYMHALIITGFVLAGVGLIHGYFSDRDHAFQTQMQAKQQMQQQLQHQHHPIVIYTQPHTRNDKGYPATDQPPSGRPFKIPRVASRYEILSQKMFDLRALIGVFCKKKAKGRFFFEKNVF